MKVKDWIRQTSLSRLLVSLFILLILFPFLVLAVVYISATQNYVKETYGRYLAQSLNVIQSQIDETSARFVDGTMNFYYNGIVELLEQEYLSDEEELELQSKLKDILNSYSGSVSSVYLNYKGYEYVSGLKYQDILQLVEPEKDAVAGNKGRHIWLGPYNCLPKRNSGTKMILAKSLNGKKEKNIAQVYLVIDIEEFSKAFKKEELTGAAHYLFSGDNRLLYSGNVENTGERLITNQLLTEKDRSYGMIRDNHKIYITASSQSKKTRWTSAVMIPMNDVLKGFTSVKALFFVLIGVYLVFLCLMLHLLEIYIVKPVKLLTDEMDSFAEGNFAVSAPETAIGELNRLNRHFNRMTTRITDLMRRNEEEVREKNEFKMQTLRAQLSPHFIYNSLNTIKWMAAINRQDNIQSVTEALIQLLMSHTKGKEEGYTLKDELALIENYAVVQKARFMNFDVIYEIAEDVKECRIVKFLLQPVVENAVIHGFARGKKRRGIIHITAYRNPELFICIEDNGVGFDVEEWKRSGTDSDQEHTHIAIRNIEQIIRLEYGNGYGITIESTPGAGTRVEYLLPAIIRVDGATLDKGEKI